MAQARHKASPKKRSRSPQQTVESLRQSLTRERELRKQGLAREKEAFEQQTATAEILKAISGSSELRPVFDAILASAIRLCNAHLGVLNLYDGRHWRTVAQAGADADFAKWLFERGPYEAEPSSPLGHLGAQKQPVAFSDIRESAAYREGGKVVVPFIDGSGARSFFIVPLLKDGAVIGGISIYRREVHPFTEKQVRLVESFADQALIAIENVRLFNETKEALEQQTAISEILRVISDSPTNVQPVLEAVAARAARICDATDARISLVEGQTLRYAAGFGDVPIGVSEKRPLNRGTAHGRAVIDRAPVHVEDMQAQSEDEYPLGRRVARETGWRTVLAVPLLREGRSLGVIVLRRTEVRPFGDKQITLLKTFADQAAIAIENVRLFNETKEALERQTATGDILRVIAGSPTNTQPVFDAVCTSAARLCDAYDALIWRVEGEHLAVAGHYGPIPTPDEPIPLVGTLSGRAAIERRTIHIVDHAAETEEYPVSSALARRHGTRTALSVPLIREGIAIGVIHIRRREVRAFSDKQIQLLKLFADQAVIAIENVRLFNETKEALEHQKASADVLSVISSSIADTKPVFDRIVGSCERLFAGKLVGINLVSDDGLIRVGAYHGRGREEFEKVFPLPLDRNSGTGLAVLERRVLHYPDVADAGVPDGVRKGCATTGIMACIFAPLLWEGRGLGAIFVGRDHVGEFTDKEIALLRTFADQAVIAIENVRLFNELQATNSTLREALEQQTATAEILRVISSSPTDIQPVLDAVAANAARVCGATDAAVMRVQGDALLFLAHHGPILTPLETGEPLQPLNRGWAPGRAVLDRTTVQIEDLLGEGDTEFPLTKELQRRLGFRTVVATPLLREGVPIGVIAIRRREAQPFSHKQIELLKTFADQAVIAIENVRLFKELQSRTEALTKSVNQLTALGEVGQAISSTLDLETVLKTIVSRAVQLTGLDAGAIYEYDEPTEQFHLVAAENMPEVMVEVLRSKPIRKGEGAVGGTAVAREPIQVPDTQDESYKGRLRDLVIRTGRRALLAVPLMHEEQIVGALAVHRNTPGPFAPEVVDLLKTFATQSALAIQNARLFREIAEKGKQLEVASHHKSQFLASMSHELRTPLNAILGFNEMLLDGLCGEVPAGFKDPLDETQKSGKHLLRLINNVLDLAKIEAGRMELALADYSVHDTVESVRSTLRPLAAEKGLEFLANVPADIPLAYGDAGRITQCLMNLAGNSLKFTKEGRVEISVQQQNGQLRYCVADTGIGIPPESIGSLFTEFKQTDATIASEYGGTGLGLSITKKFIEMHGGRIWVESEIGKGSAFIFEIPLKLGK